MDPYDTRNLGSFLGGGYEVPGQEQRHYNTNGSFKQEDEFQTSGHINYVLKLKNDPETNQNGATLEMEKSHLKLNFIIPPKSGRRFFASCEGSAGFLRQLGFQTSTLSLGYKIWHGTAILYDWTTCDGLSKISYGVSYDMDRSLTKIQLHCPPTVRTLLEPNVVSINNSTAISDKLSTEIDMDISAMSIPNPISKFRIGLKTIHDVVALPHVQIYIDFFQKKAPLKLCYQQYNDQERQSSTEVMLDLGRNEIQAKATVTQNLDAFTKFSLGVGHSSCEGLSWIFGLQKAGLCLNVPIQIMPCVSDTLNSFLYSLSTAYISFLSYCIHLACQEFFGKQRPMSFQSDWKREQDLLLMDKARKDAKNQIMLMEKKANTSKRSEESKCGLVIENAIYSIEGGERLDVTIPLQFWVSDSKLTLSSDSFGCMLGFYNIQKKQPRRVMESGSNGLVSLLEYLMDNTPTHEVMPVLYVRYKINSKTFEISVADNQALVLPSPQAIQVRM